MRNRWISIGCFLTGINYDIIKTCSELSIKRVIKYTSALLIVCLLWAFIGYEFAARYLKADWYWGIGFSIIMIFIVIQIERQIILSDKKHSGIRRFRLVIGVAMALIGTVIIDQIIFVEDIEKKKLFTINEEVKKIFPERATELRVQLNEIDSTILAKENERKSITDDLARNPFVMAYETFVRTDTSNNPVVTKVRKQVNNPKANLLEPLDKSIADIRSEKIKMNSALVSLRPAIEADIKKHVGLLDELEVMYSLLSESYLAMFAWAIWFAFLLGLELFILVSKYGETDNDYDMRMQQQMELHFRRIELLTKQSESEVKLV
ncbi:MAG TPA: DUF4407 domain-containing protein [Cyclobacteriaceae bacterium]|nr:DUF4407 domain-containing protein [Cyclobacteriaceae bacterium]